MGTDKALLEVDGVALARRATDALNAAGATRVVAVGGDASSLTALGLDVLADEFLADLAAAVERARTTASRGEAARYGGIA